MPETFDLDQAFDTMTFDVGAHTASRGADHAIGAARRRRTRIAASAVVAVIAVIAVGGAMFSQLGGSDRLSPTGEPTVPTPAPLDAAAINAATEGWISGWHVAGKDDRSALESLDQDPACMSNDSETSTPDPKRVGSALMVSDTEQVAYAVFADYASNDAGAAAAAGEIVGAMSGCTDAAVTITYGDRGSVSYYALPTGDDTAQQAWVGRLDNRLGLILVRGAPGNPPDDDVTALAWALVAALQVDESYELADSMISSISEGSASASAAAGSTPIPVHRTIGEKELADALRGWSSWSAMGDTTAMSLPCVDSRWDSGSISASGMSVGNTGEQSFAYFESARDAAMAVPALLSRLASCASADWSIDSTTVPGLVVASYDGGTVWVAYQDTTLTLFKLAGAGDPPAAVAKAVGKLVLDTLAP
jgi:hypothetical protein